MKYLVLALLLSACATKIEHQTVSATPIMDSMTYKASEPWLGSDINPSGPQVQLIHWTTSLDEECESAAQVSNGTMTVSFSYEVNHAQISWSPGCSMFDGSWNYSVSNSGLTLCHISPYEPCYTMAAQ